MLYQRSRSIVLASFLFLNFVTGCGMSNIDAPRWRYVNSIGDASAITKWTLKQVELARIIDGKNSLVDIAMSTQSSSTEVEKAVDGYIAVYQQGLIGWPVYKAPERIPKSVETVSILSLEQDARQRFVDNVIVWHSYRAIASLMEAERSASEIAFIKEFYSRLRPKEYDARNYEKWLEIGRSKHLVSN